MSFLQIVAITVLWLPYNVLILVLIKKLKPRETDHSTPNEPKSAIAIIVAYRNEQKNLPLLIETLKNQTYSHCRFVLVDDHSEDESREIAISLTESDSRFIHLSLPQGTFGKKAAIKYAVQNIEAESYLLTDADCRVSPQWASIMVTELLNKGKAMVSGTVLLSSTGKFLTKLQSVEFAYLVGLGHALIELQFPLLCNGASLGFNQHVAQLPMNIRFQSGDDVFRLHEAVKRKFSVGYVNHPNSFIFSDAQPTFNQWFWQRVRWASKTIGYTIFYTRLLSAIIVLGQWSVLILPFFVPLKLWILLFIGQLFTQTAFMLKVNKTYQQNFMLPEILTVGLFYPVFALAIALGALFRPRWKGRLNRYV